LIFLRVCFVFWITVIASAMYLFWKFRINCILMFITWDLVSQKKGFWKNHFFLTVCEILQASVEFFLVRSK
jgi:hypothetical protein